MDFHPVEANLRESFRVLASGRARGDVLELPGVTIASAGVSFQMFNAAFLSAPVEEALDLEQRVAVARAHFVSRGIAWSFWFCEDWLTGRVRRRLGRICDKSGLRLSSDMPGMRAGALRDSGPLTPLELRRVVRGQTLRDFRQIGALCFHVPPVWYAEVFDDDTEERSAFTAWTGYADGVPVATAATVAAGGAVGLYNIATLPEFRGRGYGSAITRLVAEKALAESGLKGLILQASSAGVRMYGAMGFRPVTRILAYNSVW